jgi:anti-sigma factor RsiW
MSARDRIRRMIGLRTSAPLSCSELVEIVTEYLEGTLPQADRARFEAHLEGCDGCSAYLEQMRLTVQAVGRLGQEDIPPQARETLLQAFRTWNESRR